MEAHPTIMEAVDARDELLIKYLLNEQSKAENEELEDEMVLDPELANRAQVVEMKLIDSYVLNEMTPAEKVRFEKGFLLVQENRDKVEDARAFHEGRRLRQDDVAVQLPPLAQAQSSWFASLSRAQLSALAAVLILVIALVAILFLFRPTQNKSITSNGANQNSSPQVVFQPENNNSNRSIKPDEIAELNPHPNAVRSINELRGRASTTGASPRGTGNGPVQPHLIKIPANTESVTLNVRLIPDTYYKESLECSVDISSAKFEHLFPRHNYLKVKAQPVGGEFPYQVAITIPTVYLKEGNLYYFRIVETDSLTPFKVKFTK